MPDARPTPRSAARTAAMAAALAAALPLSAALAAEVHSIRPGGDTVTGSVAAPGGVHRLPFHLAEGAVLSVSVKADRGSALRPSLLLLGTDRIEDQVATGLLKGSKKGDRVTLAGFTADSTGRRWLEVGGAHSTTGGWTLTTKVKQPRGAEGDLALPAGRVDVPFAFAAPGGGTGEIRAAAGRGAAPPEFTSLTDPDGLVLAGLEVVPDARGFRVRRVELQKPGTYVLRARSSDASATSATVSVKLKTPRPQKRKISADDVIADPVVFSVDPAQVVAGLGAVIDVGVDFAGPGAEVRFLRPPASVVFSGGAVAAIPRGLRVTAGASSFSPGTYDVMVVNPDGGSHVLEDALAAITPTPVPASVDPTSGRDDQVVRVTVTGTGFVSTSTLSLEREADAIAGTNTVAVGGSVSADLDLNGRAAGAWNVVVTNPGREPAVLVNAFEIIHDGFEVHAVTPSDDADGTDVAATVTGVEFVDGATVRLDGSPDGEGGPIAGTDVAVLDAGTIDVDFDTTGAAPGPWDLVVRLPDGRERMLEGGFHVRGPVGGPVHVTTASFGAAADGAPAAAWNSTRKEWCLAWTEENSFGIVVHWDTIVQRVGADGTALGTPAVLVHNSTLAVKRTPAISWDPARDEYLVTWAEEVTITPTQNGSDHPNGKSPTPLFQVVGQVLRGSDLAPQGNGLRFSDHTAFPAGSKAPWYVEDFHNFRPSATFDPVAGRHVVAWMQQFDTSGVQANDDFNVFQRTYDAGTTTMGGVVEVAVSSLHEGDPCVAWDAAANRVLTAYNARATDDSSPLDLRLGSGGGGPVLVAAGSDGDIADPRIAVDPATGRILLTWTRLPVKAARRVEAVAVRGSDLTSTLGDVVSPGEGEFELFGAAPAWNPGTGDALVAWTDADFDGGRVAVRGRRIRLTSTGAQLHGVEFEVSGGNGDEGAPAAVLAGSTGEVGVFWWRGVYLAQGAFPYPGTSVPGDGIVRGFDLWMVRQR